MERVTIVTEVTKIPQSTGWEGALIAISGAIIASCGALLAVISSDGPDWVGTVAIWISVLGGIIALVGFLYQFFLTWKTFLHRE